MREIYVYLDTSSLVKRYVEERGTEVLDKVYGETEAGRLKTAFSIWNVGEALGVFDRYHGRGIFSDEDYEVILRNLMSETMKMMRLGELEVLPITSGTLLESWVMVLKHHIYEADALQISSAKDVRCHLFLGAERTLLEAAEREGLTSVNIETEPERALKILDSY
jgi:predicted nucleic acid-binding protein